MRKFLETRLDKWKRLEHLTARVSKTRLDSLSGEEVLEFGRLYRRTAADLAIAREEVRDARLVNYLNYLVGRAHGAIYRSEASGFGSIANFYGYDFLAVFRKSFYYVLTAFGIFLVAAVFAGAVCIADESFADRIAPSLHKDIIAHRNWTDSANESNALAATSIQSNNIQVIFFSFGGGVLAGIGTIFIMLQNGLLLGMVMTLCVKHRFWEFPIFVSGHGVIELMAVFIAGAGGLLIGKALVIPGELGRIDALVKNGGQAIQLILGCIPMLLIAGSIEGFVSPAHISPAYKFAISALSAVTMIVYFLKPDPRTKLEMKDMQSPTPR